VYSIITVSPFFGLSTPFPSRMVSWWRPDIFVGRRSSACCRKEENNCQCWKENGGFDRKILEVMDVGSEWVQVAVNVESEKCS
jgi:hypothetical protein